MIKVGLAKVEKWTDRPIKGIFNFFLIGSDNHRLIKTLRCPD